MGTKDFLEKVCKKIKYKPIRASISEELKTHIEEIEAEYIANGVDKKSAEEKAIKQMGDAHEIGEKLNKIHRPKLEWKLLILITILTSFGIIVSILKQGSQEEYSYIGKTIFYIIVGIIIGILIYFFDYRKLKNYSNYIYLIATLIMLMPIFNLGYKVNGIYYVRILNNISFSPVMIANPLYIIAFIGYISNYDRNNSIIIHIKNEEFKVKYNFIKILVLSILSLILIIKIPSITNAILLSIIYLILITIKIMQTKPNCVRKLVMIYGTVITIGIIILCFAIVSESPRFNRIILSLKPEIDPNGAGYTGMLQKEILENAKLIGEADTEVIRSDDIIITKESNFTFIYLIGKAGILISLILVLTIVLTSLRLIINARNIKDQYGKLLIIGLSTLYILESLASVLMNLNLGIKADINLPFVTYGGVYFLINSASIALILSIYRRKDINIEKCESKKLESIEEENE